MKVVIKCILAGLLLVSLTSIYAVDGDNPYLNSTSDPYTVHSVEAGKDAPIAAQERGDVDFIQGN